jgi:8-amino-7-oxononanoate synthase
MNLADRWAAALLALRENGRYRALTPPGGVDFTSNDYLGYASGRLQPPREETAWPRSGAASRLLRGHHPLWEQVEASLADGHGAEAALVFTSGYAANEGLLSTVIEAGDWVASDALNHASIIDGLRLSRAEKVVYRHSDLGHLEELLKAAVKDRQRGRQRFVVTESLFGMDGDLCPLAELVALAARYHAHVIVDEAHATGCLGPRGAGLVDAAGLRNRVLATVHTGGKALGVAGAYVCGSHLLREVLVNRCRHFIFTTALPPALAAWWLDALARVQGDDEGRRLLARNAGLLRAALASHGVQAGGAHHILPVVLGADRRATGAAAELRQAGWDIRAIRPPTVPDGTARLRLAVHADHDEGTLRRAATAVGEAVRRWGGVS